jgi:hypothetical protein
MQDDRRVPQLARQVLELLAAQLDEVANGSPRSTPGSWLGIRRILSADGSSPSGGSGLLIATAIAATVPDRDAFRGGREFAAWLGPVPRQRFTGGKPRLGRISRRGDKYIRQLLIVGPQTVLLRSVRCVDPGPAGETTPPRSRRGSDQQGRLQALEAAAATQDGTDGRERQAEAAGDHRRGQPLPRGRRDRGALRGR